MAATVEDPSRSPEEALSPTEALRRKLKHRNERGWRHIALHFTPSWFSVNMGTGIVSILLHNLPYNGYWLRCISLGIFGLNTFLFFIFLILSIIRYTVYRGIFFSMLRHPVQSLFLGTFPMGFATICNMFVFACVPAWGARTLDLAWAMWWIDVVLAVVTCMFLPFAIMYIHPDGTEGHEKLKSMTAVWLLPVVSTIVAAASGGIVAETLSDHGRNMHAFWTVITSYVLLGTGLPLAMVILVIYFQRLTTYRLPPQAMIVSVFLPLGPLGQGSYALMQLGRVMRFILVIDRNDLPVNVSEQFGPILEAFGVVVALLMWGYGLVWLFFALASVSRHEFPFNIGWWGFTFPLGVFAVSTSTLGHQLSSPFFNIVGTIFSLCVVSLWLVVGAKTAWATYRGTMFFAPCAAAFEEQWISQKLDMFEKRSMGGDQPRGYIKLGIVI